MKYKGWAYIDHMVMACEELFEFTQGIASGEELKIQMPKQSGLLSCASWT